jgi:hypothetical protein
MKFFRNIIVFSLIPAIVAAGYTLVKDFLYFMVCVKSQYISFWVGVLCCIMFQIIFHKPTRTYILGHELSHAVVGILSGAKIKKFSVKKKSGSVILTKNTIWIGLAPYLFPIYTFIITIIYVFINCFIDIRKFYGYFIFIVGFSITFHITLTVHTLLAKQSDLKAYGVFPSYVLILALNTIVFTLLIALIFPKEMNIKSFFFQMLGNIEIAYKIICSGALLVWQKFQKTN